jgi:hypothetical protein
MLHRGAFYRGVRMHLMKIDGRHRGSRSVKLEESTLSGSVIPRFKVHISYRDRDSKSLQRSESWPLGCSQNQTKVPGECTKVDKITPNKSTRRDSFPAIIRIDDTPRMGCSPTAIYGGCDGRHMRFPPKTPEGRSSWGEFTTILEESGNGWSADVSV